MSRSARGRIFQVVDSNVPITANRRDGGTYSCAAECAQALHSVMRSGAIVLDRDGEIIEEYKRYLNFSGQPGPGDAFFRWLVNSRWRSDLCEHVALTRSGDASRGYDEFPDHPGLKEFDPADRKFVAVANGHADKPIILQATDSKWVQWEDSLTECGIKVEFVCPDELGSHTESNPPREVT